MHNLSYQKRKKFKKYLGKSVKTGKNYLGKSVEIY